MLVAILVAIGLSQTMRGAEATAFELIKEGNRHVGELAKDKVVQIPLRKIGRQPEREYMVGRLLRSDGQAQGDGGQVWRREDVEVNRPMRLLEPVTGGRHAARSRQNENRFR